MDENHRKSPILHCERSERGLHFEWTKVHQKCQKWSILASFWKQDKLLLIGQKLMENAKIKKKNWNATFSWISKFSTCHVDFTRKFTENLGVKKRKYDK